MKLIVLPPSQVVQSSFNYRLMFTTAPSWNNEQKIVLNCKPNIIVRGCAGSGKTLLSVHLSQILATENKSVLVLVYTKALKRFIEQSLGNKANIDVLNSDSWALFTEKHYDYIIIDEAQDFSIEDIESFKRHAKLGIYIFIDELQKLYKEQNGKPTLNLSSLREYTGFPVVDLKFNCRISKNIVNFLSDVFPNTNLTSSTNDQNVKPKVVKYNSAMEELEWIKNYIIGHPFESIGILLKVNDRSLSNIYPDGKKREDLILGIPDIRDYLHSQAIAFGYKYKEEDNLDFKRSNHVNVLTVHGSKGIEFDTVIIPFFNYSYVDSLDSLDYVAMTRCKNNLIMTYTNIASKRLNQVEKENFDGEIRKFVYEKDWDREHDYDMIVEMEKRKMLERVKKGLH